MIHFDTSFAVDLMRESAAEQHGPARGMLATFRQTDVAISLFVACELAAGVALARRPSEERAKVERFCAHIRVVYPDEGFADSFAEIVQSLKRSGRNVGAMDILIATAAVRENAQLVTRNKKDFAGVPGLDIILY